jgi:hypothetical protein
MGNTKLPETQQDPSAAVPSGSAGEPTPTPFFPIPDRPTNDLLEKLADRPEVAAAMEAYLAASKGVARGATVPEVVRSTDALFALLGTVAAAATAQTADAAARRIEALAGDYYGADMRRLLAEAEAVRALAGGAPPATQTTDTTEE